MSERPLPGTESKPQITSRAEAMALGLKRYFTGKPCCRGHYSERYVRGVCVQCVEERDSTISIDKKRKLTRDSYKRHREKRLEEARRYRDKNRELLRKRDLERYYANREINRKKKNASAKEYRSRPEVRERNAERSKRPEVKQIASQRRRDRYQRDAEFRAHCCEYGRRYRRKPENKQKAIEYQRSYKPLWRDKNRQRLNEKSKQRERDFSHQAKIALLVLEDIGIDIPFCVKRQDEAYNRKYRNRRRVAIEALRLFKKGTL